MDPALDPPLTLLFLYPTPPPVLNCSPSLYAGDGGRVGRAEAAGGGTGLGVGGVLKETLPERRADINTLDQWD